MMRPVRSALVELVDAKMSDAKIAAEFGVTGRTVLRWRTDLAMPSKWEPARAPHGTASAYHRGCRCAPCRAAHTAHHRARRASKRAQQ